MNKFDKCENAR